MDGHHDPVTGLNRLRAFMEASDEVRLSFLKEFPVLNIRNIDVTSHQLLDFDRLKAALEKEKLTPSAYEGVLLFIMNDVRLKVVPKFVENFKIKCGILDGYRKFQESVKDLHTSVLGVLNPLHKIEDFRLLAAQKEEYQHFGTRTAFESYKISLAKAISLQLPTNYTTIVQQFYAISFKAFCHCNYPPLGAGQIKCSKHANQPNCGYMRVLTNFDHINQFLCNVGLLDKLVGSSVSGLAAKRTLDYVDELCRRPLHTPNIERIESWIDKVIMVWVNRVYRAGQLTDRQQGQLNRTLRIVKTKLMHRAYEAYGKRLIEAIPASFSVVDDVKFCLQQTDLKLVLLEKIKNVFSWGLLHVGMSTEDILAGFVAAVPILQRLDPSGRLLNLITSPIRGYLPSRDDVPQSIVAMLTGPKKIFWKSWLPDPVEIVPDTGARRYRAADIITMLVNVFGIEELFVDEYRKLLADRLLSPPFARDINTEIQTLQYLKWRFGDSETISQCEVMLKDAEDSLIFTANLLNDPSYGIQALAFNMGALVLSSQFWPPFEDTPLQLPDIVIEHFEKYTKAFETDKNDRTLSWKPSLGVVTVEIELKDRTLNLSVSPVLATIIWHFQTQSEWNLPELSEVMMVPCSVLKRNISFWQSQGVLAETAPDTYIVLEESPDVDMEPQPSMPMLYEEEETDEQDQTKAMLEVFWSYIIGMLTTSESMRLDRIYQMLKMFASQGSVTLEVSAEQLRNFLDKKVEEHSLNVSEGSYKLAE